MNPESQPMLTAVQQQLVASAFPECRAEMTRYLKAGVDVQVRPQTECGPDVPAIAISVASDPSFWIDCCDTIELARSRATELGLRVVERPDSKT